MPLVAPGCSVTSTVSGTSAGEVVGVGVAVVVGVVATWPPVLLAFGLGLNDDVGVGDPDGGGLGAGEFEPINLPNTSTSTNAAAAANTGAFLRSGMATGEPLPSLVLLLPPWLDGLPGPGHGGPLRRRVDRLRGCRGRIRRYGLRLRCAGGPWRRAGRAGRAGPHPPIASGRRCLLVAPRPARHGRRRNGTWSAGLRCVRALRDGTGGTGGYRSPGHARLRCVCRGGKRLGHRLRRVGARPAVAEEQQHADQDHHDPGEVRVDRVPVVEAVQDG